MANGWRYLWRRYLGWCPIQWCLVCRCPYWGGWPRQGWRAWMMEYCSANCCREDEDFWDEPDPTEDFR